MNYFDLCIADSILFYGDNFISRPLYEKMINYGFSVKAIIDRKYNSIMQDVDGLKFLPVELLSSEEFPINSIIIVCMSNGLTQESVLNGLINKGYENIIYLPMLNNRPIIEQDILRRAYSDIMTGCFENILHIPKTYNLDEKDTVIIYKNQVETAFLCPVYIIYTGTKALYDEQKLPLNFQIAKKYFDIPIEQDEPFKDLFNYFMKKADYPYKYLEWMRSSVEEQNRLLEDRKKLFSIYEQNFEYNFSFFLYSPIRADWNEKGHINIHDGHHRCLYLVCKGKKYVPIAMKNGDYEKLIKSKIMA